MTLQVYTTSAAGCCVISLAKDTVCFDRDDERSFDGDGLVFLDTDLTLFGGVGYIRWLTVRSGPALNLGSSTDVKAEKSKFGAGTFITLTISAIHCCMDKARTLSSWFC